MKESNMLDRLRIFIFSISGSAAKETERAEKGLKARVFEAFGAKVVDSEEKVLRFSSKRLVFLTSVMVIFAVLFLFNFTTWTVGYTSSEKFCIGCHEMKNSYRDWKTSSHYDSQSGVVASCADCHLPTDMASKIKVKMIAGFRDTFMHYFGNPEKLDFQELAKKARKNIRDDSCTKCHKNLFPALITKGGLIAHRALEMGEKKKCVDCHQNFVHNFTPYRETAGGTP